MLNKINTIGNYTQISKPTFKSQVEKKDSLTTNPTPEINSVEALANYGIASIKLFKEFKMTPTPLIEATPYATDSIKGERIYSSDGSLYSIVDENEETKTTYLIDNDIDENCISRITVLNKESNEIVKEQLNYFDEDDDKLELEEIFVTEYSFSTGKPVRSSTYKDGELIESTNYVKKKNGLDETVSYVYKDKTYTVSQSSPNNDFDTYFRISKDLKFVDMDLTKKAKDSEHRYSMEFYNGALIATTESKRKTSPNLMGREPMNDNDLIPAKKYNLSIITPDFEGEKTYYSNGAIESIKTTDGTAYFTPDGSVRKLESENITIQSFDNGNMLITEDLDNDKIRYTTYRSDSINVLFSNNDQFKELTLTSKFVPTRYAEGVFDEDGDRDSQLVYYYDKNGVLDTVFNF